MDNYFLKEYSQSGIVFLRSQFIRNARIHLLGVLICLPCVIAGGRLPVQLLVLLVLLHTLYCVLIQIYNIIRIEKLLNRHGMS